MEFFLGALLGLIPIVLIVLVVVYLNRTNLAIQRMNALEKELRRLLRLEDELAELKGRFPVQERASRAGVPAEAAPPEAQPLPPRPAVVPPVVRGEPLAQAPPLPLIPRPSAVTEKRKPSRTREEWEALIGGKLLNRIGALALVIGVAFFLKYAFDNNWITETMRVVIGVVIGTGLLVLANSAHRRKFEVFSQGLVGAGISVLYLSVFASFNFYHLVPQVAAFFLMSAVTILAFLQAFRYDSFAVSILGLLGGFLTPFLLSTGEANEIGLFTYVALLDAGLLAVVLTKDKWSILEPLALGGTYLIYVLWYNEFYTPDSLLVTVYLLMVFWVLFYALEQYRNARSSSSFVELRNATGAANVMLLYIALYSLIEPDHHDVMGLVTLCLGAIYCVTALLIRKASAGSVFFRLVLTAIVMLVLATAIEYTGFRTVQWWSVEALALAYCGVRWNARFVWMSALVIFGLALIKLLFNPEAFSASPVIDAGLLLNQRTATFVLFSASMGVGAVLLRKTQEPRRLLLAGILNAVWPVVIFGLLTAEAAGYFSVLQNSASGDMKTGLEFKELMTLPVIWMLYSLILTWSGLRWNVIPWRYVGLGAVVVSVSLALERGISYEPIGDFTLIANFRFVALLLVLAGLCVHALWMRKKQYLETWNADALSTIGVVIVIVIFDLVTGEAKDVFQKAKSLCEQSGPGAGSPEWNRLVNLQQLSLSAVWLLYSIALMVVGIWRRQRGIRIASFALFGFTILKIFIYDLSFLDTLYRIFSFIGLGVILLAVSYLYQRYKEIIFREEKTGDESPSPG